MGSVRIRTCDRFRERKPHERAGFRGERIGDTPEPRHALKISVLATAALLIFCIPAWSQNTNVDEHLSASACLRRAVDGELKAQGDDHSHWMYELRSKVAGTEKVKLVIETPEGHLDRLLSVDGRPVTAEEEQLEEQRINGLLHKTDEQKKRQHAQQEDQHQTEHMFKMLPEAVLATYGQHNGDLVEILFRPNPDFKPLTREDVVFHSMEGHIWINEKQNRLAEIDGHLIKEVKFYGGLLGYLNRGGEFHVRQSEIGSGHWEITLLHVNMKGKALFFKTISVQQDETQTDFRRVPDNLTLAQAAQELQKECTVHSPVNHATAS
jgi:hypothetical protein